MDIEKYMLNLISLLIIPLVFIGCVLVVSNNMYWNINWFKTNNLKQISLLEEVNYMIPYVLRKYYSYIMNIRSNLIPSLITTSFWHENMEYIKEKGLKDQKELISKLLKRIGLLLSIVLYIVIILFWLKYRRTTLGYQLLTNTGSTKGSWNLNITLGLDGISLPFIVLIGFIFPIVYISNWSTIDKLDINYIIIIISLELCLIIVFLVIDLILFYVFFESILPLLFVLIGLYGAAQKFRAGYYLFLYTFKVGLGNSCLCTRAKFRGSPKALVTKIIKETWWLAPLMTGGMVISLEMTEMKWVIVDLNQTMSVKEQRVDGSSALSKNAVRCTLVAGKPVLGRKITHLPYNFQYSRSLFHTTTIVYNKYENKLSILEVVNKKTLSTTGKLDPWFITGFVDAEGCFSIGVYINYKYQIGYQVQAIFQISLHNKDLVLLSKIQSYFGGGNIRKHGKSSIIFRITSLKNLNTVISHFDKYPLISQKWADYGLFKQVLELIKNKKHLTTDGFKEILSIKASMNLGLPESLKTAFLGISQIIRPEVMDNNIKDPNWVVGFTNGEGCFFVYVTNSSTTKLSETVRIKFQITQHVRDSELMKKLITLFQCGRIESTSHNLWLNFIVTNFKDITEKVIPFFDKYPIQGTKMLDFLDFKRVANLMKNKAHLSKEGLHEIRFIKSKMNSRRIFLVDQQ